MEEFCSAYWYPVYAFTPARTGPEDARDLTQAFFQQNDRR